jgi:hypothetical protein
MCIFHFTSFMLATLDVMWGLIIVMGLQAVLFGLMPFRFLGGHALREWNSWAWGLLYGMSACFYSIVLMGANRATLGQIHTNHTELQVVWPFLGFAALSIAFRGYFALRDHRRRTTSP